MAGGGGDVELRGGGRGDGDRGARGGDRLVGAGLGIKVGEIDGAERVSAGLGGDEDDVFGEGDVEEFAVGGGAFGFGLDDLEIVGDVALGQTGEVGPVAGAAEFEGPRDGFADGGFLGDDFGDEFELADGAAESGGRGRGEGADGEGGPGGLDGEAFEARGLEEAEADAAGLQADDLGDGVQREGAGVFRVGAGAIHDVELGLAVDDAFAGFGLGPVFGDQRAGAPVGVGFELAEIAAVDVEGVEEREDFAGPEGVGAGDELGRGGGFEGGIAGGAGGLEGRDAEVALVGFDVEGGDGDGVVGPGAETIGELHVVGAAEVIELGARALAGEIGLHALDGREARCAVGRAVLEDEDEFGGVGVGGLPADGLGVRAGGAQGAEHSGEGEKEGEADEAHGRGSSSRLT